MKASSVTLRQLFAYPAALLLVCACGGDSPDLGQMQVVKIVDEVLARQGTWQVVEGAPEVGILTPYGDYKVDAGDLPAVLMRPPCELSFEVPSDLGAAGGRLQLTAGVDREVYTSLRREDAPSFGFEVKRGDTVVFQDQITIQFEQKKSLRGWRRPQGEAGAGIVCAPGDKFTLRTWQIDGLAMKPEEGWKIGFGELRIETSQPVSRAAPSAREPNMILIVQDTLRFDRTSLGQTERPTTPNLLALAERGTSFTAAEATSSWTWPATASILTGLTPEVHGVASRESCYLASGNETVAEALQLRGYTTGAFTRNPLVIQEKNFNQGFESFDDSYRFEKTSTLFPKITAWLEAHQDERFFLYLHLVDSHGPLTPLPREAQRIGVQLVWDDSQNQLAEDLRQKLMHGAGYNEQRERIDYVGAEDLAMLNDTYDASVATGDVYLGELIDWLAGAGLLDKTVIAFTADHGEEWLDHGQVGHAHSLFPELVHVPLVIAGPGIPVGKVDSDPVSNRRLAGTLAHIGQADLGPEVGSLGIDGYDLDGRPSGPVFTSTRYGLWRGHRDEQVFGIRVGDEVLHFAPTGRDMGAPPTQTPERGQWSLYELDDRGVAGADLAALRPERAQQLLDQLLDSLSARSERAATLSGAVRVGAGAETLEMLGRIGYLDD